MSPALTMTEAITALVTEKRATGYKYDTEQRVLTRFAAFCAGEFPGQQAPTQQLEAERAEIGRPQRRADAPRQPRQQVILLRLHLDRMAHFTDVKLVRVERLGGDHTRRPRALPCAAPKPAGSAADQGCRHRQGRL